ncbi:MAG: hypothetical protein IJE07_06875 [Clostridia bacterium]|nr:hypothetical protein [Clostridia bacterium]
MTCMHRKGGLQILIHQQGSWFSRCLCCHAEYPAKDVTLPVQAGETAARAAMDMDARRFARAAAAFDEALSQGGDPRCHMGALLCELGVAWCGDEYQPTFTLDAPPRQPLEDNPRWQTLAQQAPKLPAFAWQGLEDLRRELEAILGPMREDEGRSACDVFLCYRRTPANINRALKLYRDLTDKHLRVFCADFTTRGKTQEQFESLVGHALRTAEYMVILPGDGENALTPWMLNEIHRAACPEKNRYIVSDGHASLPDIRGQILSMEKITQELLSISADCRPHRLWERALSALKQESGTPEALRLLERASTRGDNAARLMLATLFEEGALLPADPARSAHYRRLAADVDEATRQRVYAALGEVEQARHIARRNAVIYIAADVSDAGLAASQALMKPLLAALQADRRLAMSEVCLVGYDRHARVLEPAKALEKYGLPGNAARMLHTLREGGRDQQAYAAKGLRLCAAEHLSRKGDLLPLVVLLATGAQSDAPQAVEAALESVSGVFANCGHALLTGAAQIPACIAGLLSALR